MNVRLILSKEMVTELFQHGIMWSFLVSKARYFNWHTLQKRNISGSSKYQQQGEDLQDRQSTSFAQYLYFFDYPNILIEFNSTTWSFYIAENNKTYLIFTSRIRHYCPISTKFDPFQQAFLKVPDSKFDGNPSSGIRAHTFVTTYGQKLRS
jgi:hypothetical protein